MAWILYVELGTAFGFVLSRSGAADYNYIQQMFLFESFQLYGIMGSAIAVLMPGLWLLKRAGRTAGAIASSIATEGSISVCRLRNIATRCCRACQYSICWLR